MKSFVRGFTLLELLIATVIIALGSAGVVLALRNEAAVRLEREAVRLAALLEGARAVSRASGAHAVWIIVPGGFRFQGLPGPPLPTRWLDSKTDASVRAPVLLGPEPVIGPQSIVLRLADQPLQSLQVATDGVGPFRVVNSQHEGEP